MLAQPGATEPINFVSLPVFYCNCCMTCLLPYLVSIIFIVMTPTTWLRLTVCMHTCA